MKVLKRIKFLMFFFIISFENKLKGKILPLSLSNGVILNKKFTDLFINIDTRLAFAQVFLLHHDSIMREN